MAERTPLFMDINAVYSGDELGLPLRHILGEGIVSAGAMAVTAGAGNTVDVAAGTAFVLGDTDPVFQPNYLCINDAVKNLGINPDPALARKVLIVAQITDEAFSGTGREWELVAIHGTPAGSPVDPALPDSALSLASILVPAAAASSAAYTITDTRELYALAAGLGSAAVPKARAFHNTTQTMTSAATNQVVVFNDEDYDTDGIHDPATNNSRLTCQTDGLYRILAHIVFDTQMSAADEMELLLNGATVIAREGIGADARTIDTEYDLVEGDYVEVRIVSNSTGATRTILSNSNSPIFMMRKLPD